MQFRLAYVLLLSVALSSVSFARFNAWEPENGVSVRQGYNISWTYDAISVDENGNWCVSWSDGHSGQYNVYAQLYDSAGNPLWGNEPLLIAEGPWLQIHSSVFKGDDDSWIIAWDDFRNDINKEAKIVRYAQKVAIDGTFIWADQGVPIFDSANSSIDNKTISDENGGLFHVWYDIQNGIRMQHLDSNGSRLWGLEGLLHHTDVTRYCITASDNDLIIMSWNYMGNYFVNFNRYNVNGEAEWGTNGISIETDNVIGNIPSLFVDENDNIYGIWTYFGSNNIDAIAFDSEGTILCDPATIASNGRYLVENSTVLLESNHFRVVYSTPDADICFQDITCTGEDFLTAYELTGLPVASLNQTNGLSCFGDGDNGCFLTYRDYENYETNRFFSMIHVDTYGELTWAEPLVISSYGDPMVNPIVADENVIMIKKDDVEENIGLHFDFLDVETGTMVNNNPDIFDYTVVEGIQFDCYDQGITKSGDNVYTTWIDLRSDSNRLPFIQKNDFITGERQWAENGIPIISDPDEYSSFTCYDLISISDSENGTYAAFASSAEMENGQFQFNPVIIQRISESGELLWGENGVRAAGNNTYQSICSGDPHLFINSQDEICLFYVVYSNGNWSDGIIYQKFSPDGERLLGDVGVIVSPVNSLDNDILKVIPHGDNFHVFYQNGNAQNTTLLLTAVSSDGELLWDEAVELGNYFDNGTYDRRDAVKVGSNTAVVWFDDDTDCYLANLIDLDGNRVNSQEPVEILSITDFTYKLSLAEADDNSFWFAHVYNDRYDIVLNRLDLSFDTILTDDFTVSVENTADDAIDDIQLIPDLEQGVNVTWIEDDGGAWTGDIRHFHLTGDGNSVHEAYGDFGLTVCDAWYAQRDFFSVPDGEGGFLMAWNDFRAAEMHPEDMLGSGVYITRINDNTTDIEPSETSNAPTAWDLLPAYPNPFNPSTSIKYHVAADAVVNLTVYDLLGRKVTNLVNEHKLAGQYSITWNGKDNKGLTVASGIYFYRFKADNVNLIRSMILIK